MPLPKLDQLKIIPPQPVSAMMEAGKYKDSLRRTDVFADRNKIARERMGLDRETFEFNKEKAAFAASRDFIGGMDRNELPDYKDWLGKFPTFGPLASLLPTQTELFEMSEEEFTDLIKKIEIGTDNMAAMDRVQAQAAIKEVQRIQANKDKVAAEKRDLAAFKEKEDYKKKIGGDEGKNLTEMQLTELALAGDEKAKKILASMTARKIEVGKAAAQGKIEGLYENIDIEGAAQAILDGRETIENVKNTFGVPIQEAVRKAVMEKDSEFNFLLPRAVVRSLDTSLKNQEKQRGLMGSFVRNINKQVSRVDEIAQEVGRWGVRALDLPKRELITRLMGSGKEKVLEAYLTEISAEIGKLSTGSSASIRELSTEGQARWNKIHDPNLSIGELKTILEETRDMAEMRISSTNEEIEFTKKRLENLKTGSSTTLQRSGPQTQQLPSKFEILSVE